MPDELDGYTRLWANEMFDYYFPSGWNMWIEDDPENKQTAFHIQEIAGRQFGKVSIAYGVKASRIKDVLDMEFRALKQAIDNPADEKKLMEQIKNAEKNVAALRWVKEHPDA